MKPCRSKIFLSLVNLSVLLLASSARVSAVSLDDVKSGELLFHTGEPGVYEAAPALASDVHVEVSGIVARSRVTQIFANLTDHFMEAVYVFPLAENAAVDGLHMVIGSRVVEGRIAENGEAKKVYQEATEAGKKAALVEQQRPNLFTASVANIGPGEEVEIVLEVQQVVAVSHGRFSLRFPMVAMPRYVPAWATEGDLLQAPLRAAGREIVNPFVFHVDLYPGIPLSRVESSSHAVQVSEREGPLYTVDLARGAASADRDFVLSWEPAAGREPRAALYTQEVGGERYALLMVVPPKDAAKAARLPRETIFVIDTSGSMEGTSIEQAKAALLQGLAQLQPGDRFNVVQFNSSTVALYETSAPADAIHLEEAAQFVKRLAANGGTEMLPALTLALRDDGEGQGAVRQVIFATDGGVSNEDELFTYIRGHLGRSRLFTVGIGSAPNTHFMQKAAEYGRGTFVSIARVEDLKEKVDTLLAQIDTPVLTDVAVGWDDPKAEAWPQRIPDLYEGEPLVISAHLAGRGERVAVSGRRSGGEPWRMELPLGTAAPGKGIDKLWARRKVEALTDSLAEPMDPGRREQETEVVRRAVTDLGLRHGLVTAYTSLVAVDGTASAPAGTAPLRSMVPVAVPAGSLAWSAGSGGPIEECITVTTESPLLDERKISLGSTVTQTELEKVPRSRNPWEVLERSPGVLASRVDGIGASGGPAFVGPGSTEAQGVLSIDGFEVAAGSAANGNAAGLSVLGAVALEEVQASTNGLPAATDTPGVQLNLITKRGTNEWRGSGLAERTGGSARAEAGGVPADRQRSASFWGAEMGGPLHQDHLWIWGALGRRADDRTALGGQGDSSSANGGSGKLSAQLTTNDAMNLFWSHGTDGESGRGAGPERAPEATWKQDGENRVWKAEDSWIRSSNFFLTGTLGGVDASSFDRPLGGSAAGLDIDAGGVARGSALRFSEDRRTRSASVLANGFWNTGQVSHEGRVGGGWRNEDASNRQIAPGLGRLEIAGTILGLPDGTSAVGTFRDGAVSETFRRGDLWLDDTLAVRSLTLQAGLRLDVQELREKGSSAPAVRFRDLVPRLGANWALGAERKTLLKASLGRYASRLGEEVAGQASPGAPGIAWSFADANGGLRPWYTENLDPLLPVGASPNRIARDLRAETTDELTAGIENSLLPEWVVGFHATWRRTGHLFERRLLVRDGATGEVFAATNGDWVPAGVLSGTLPGGRLYAVPYYDLRPGLQPTGGTLLVNGDRRQEYRGLTLDWNKRLSNRWMSRGSLTWRDWRWELGPNFARYDDPTNTLGSGDDDRQPVAPAADPLGRFGQPGIFLSSRWAFHADGLYQLPGGFELGGAVNGRQGFPLPWFRQVARPNAGLASVQLSDRFDAVRAGSLVTLDARLAREIDLPQKALSFSVSLDALNLLSSGTVLARQLDLGTTRAGAADQVLAPRTFRLRVQVGWR